MSGSKVPRDPTLTPEMRRFLDDQARAADDTAADLASAIAALPSLASQAEAEAGTDNVKYMSALRVAQAVAVLAPAQTHIHVRDEKAANTAGGGFTSGADRTRTLNTTVTNTISGASLSSDQVTLPAGTYRVTGSVPGYGCGTHRAWLYNVTDTTTALLGSSEDQGGTITQTRSFVSGLVTIASSKVFELRHRCSTTRGTDGMGRPVNFNSANEVYADLLITKVS